MRTAEALAAVIARSHRVGRPSAHASGVPRAAAETMGGDGSLTIGGGITLIVIGAILRFGITWKPRTPGLEAIGVILMVVGGVGLIISVVFVAAAPRTASAQVWQGAPLNRHPDQSRVARRTAIWSACATRMLRGLAGAAVRHRHRTPSPLARRNVHPADPGTTRRTTPEVEELQELFRQESTKYKLPMPDGLLRRTPAASYPDDLRLPSGSRPNRSTTPSTASSTWNDTAAGPPRAATPGLPSGCWPGRHLAQVDSRTRQAGVADRLRQLNPSDFIRLDLGCGFSFALLQLSATRGVVAFVPGRRRSRRSRRLPGRIWPSRRGRRPG